MRFANFIERMTLEEKLTFIMRKDTFQTNTLEKFDIPSIDIQKLSELRDHVLPEHIPTSSFDYKYITKYGKYIYNIVKSKTLLRVDVTEFESDYKYVTKKLLSSYLTSLDKKAIIDFTLSKKSFSEWIEILNKLDQTYVLVKSNVDLELINGLKHRVFVDCLNSEDAVSAIKNGSIFTIYHQDEAYQNVLDAVKESAKLDEKSVEYEKALLENKILPESIIDIRANELLETICLLDTKSEDNILNFKTDSDLAYDENAISTVGFRESTVLLKNQNNILPLPKQSKLLVVGEMVNSLKADVNYDLLLDTIGDNQLEIVGRCEGYSNKPELLPNLYTEVVMKSKSADYILFFTESLRSKEVIKLLEHLKETHNKIIVCLNSKNIDLDPNDLSKMDALIWYRNYGSALSLVLPEILSGNTCPSGKLLKTVKYKNEVIFPFGYGLSYANFKLRKYEIEMNHAKVIVDNKSEFDALYTAILFSFNTKDKNPVKEVIGFKKWNIRFEDNDEIFVNFDEDAYESFDKSSRVSVTLAGNDNELLATANLKVAKASDLDEHSEKGSKDKQKAQSVYNNFKVSKDNKITVEDKEGLSPRKKILITLLAVIYIDFLFLMARGNESINIEGFDGLMNDLILITTVIGLFIIIKQLIRRKKNLKNNLDAFIRKTENIDPLFKVVYEKPVKEEEKEKEEVVEEETNDNESSVYNTNYNISVDKKVKKVEHQLSVEELSRKFIEFSKENGFNIDIELSRNIFSAMASSNLIFLSALNKDAALDLEEIIAKFFGLDLFQTDLKNVFYEKDLYWIMNQTTNEYDMTDFTKSIVLSENIKSEIVPTFLNNVDFEKLGRYFDLHLQSISSNLKKTAIKLDETKTVHLNKNIWYFMLLDENCKPNRKFAEFGVTIDVNTPSQQNMNESIQKLDLISVRDFNRAVTHAKQEHFINENYWKKLDEFMESLSNVEYVELGNKNILQIEKFSAVYQHLSLDEADALDNMFKSKIVPIIKSMNFYKADNGAKIVNEIIFKAFGEDLLSKSNKALRK